MTKVTIKSGNKTYISVDIDGHGNLDNNYNIRKVFEQLSKENFPAFNGTTEEWEVIKAEVTQTKIENMDQ